MLSESEDARWGQLVQRVQSKHSYSLIMYMFWVANQAAARHKFRVEVLGQPRLGKFAACEVFGEWVQSCGLPLLAQVDWCSNVYRFCGFLFASSNALVLACWLSTPAIPVQIFDVSVYACGMIAMVLLNSVNKSSIMSRDSVHMRKISISFMFLCFVFLLVPLLWPAWQLTTQESCANCLSCHGAEMTGSMLTLLLATCLRFADSIYAPLWDQRRTTTTQTVHGMATSVMLAVLAALLLMSGVFFQAYCMFQLDDPTCAKVVVSQLF